MRTREWDRITRAARHLLDFARRRLRRMARSTRRVGRGLARLRLDRLTLLDERLEHFHPFGLGARKGPEPREPDLARGFEH